MEKFDQYKKCPKCGSMANLTKYHDDRLDEDGIPKPNPVPFLGRECMRCGFWRSEAPLDAAEDGQSIEVKLIILPDNWNMYQPAGRHGPSAARVFQLTGRYEETSACPKCGTSVKTGTQWVSEIIDDDGHIFSLSASVMERECPRCGFVRYECPLDATEGEVRATLKGRPLPRLDGKE